MTTVDGASVLVKFPVSDFPGREESLLENEFNVFKALRDAGVTQVLQPIRLQRMGHKLVAYYENCLGSPLVYAGTGSDVGLLELGSLVHRIGTLLENVHRSGRALVVTTPSSFLRDPSGNVVMVDAALTAPVGAIFGDDDQLLPDCYLPYAAPEVVGRAPLSVDHRTDLYALGAMLFHFLAGRVPFPGDDPAEIIQGHLARDPPSLVAHNPEVPEWLATLIARLLSKRPDARGASVDAVLRELARQLDPTGTVFAPAQYGSVDSDRPPEVAWSEDLYERDGALETLRAMARDRSGPAIAFIEGQAGIGKTALVGELLRSEQDALGLVCSGKFAQAGHTAPLAAWSAVLRDLAGILLTKRTVELNAWRERIARALGDLAPDLGALAPEWSSLLNLPKVALEAAPEASPNRVALALQRLLQTFSAAGAPVTVFLDDLQWADESSLRILELLLTATDAVDVLVLAACRLPESPLGGEGSPVLALRSRLAAAVIEVEVVPLAPLSPAGVDNFLSDSFDAPIATRASFIDILMEKAGGNPFFLREFLKLLIQRGILRFRSAEAVWVWERTQLRALRVAENVVAFLAQRIATYPEPIKETLCLCTCLGTRFTAGEFATAANVPVTVALERLSDAASVLCPRDGGAEPEASGIAGAATCVYEFVHDRLFEACHALMEPDERAHRHIEIARRFVATLTAASAETTLYRIASHYNAAITRLDDPEERYRAAELDLKAGKIAKKRGAFSQALDYFRAGLEFLGGPSEGEPDWDTTRGRPCRGWQEKFDLALELHESTAEAALLNGRLGLMHRLCDEILARSSTPYQKISAYDIRISGLKAEKRFSDAVDKALEILRELGVTFPRRPTLRHAAVGFVFTKLKLKLRPMAKVASLPAMQDARIKAISRIIQSVYAAAYLGRPTLFPLMVYRHVADSLAHGNEDYSAVTYSAFAAVMCAMGDFDNAFRLGYTALGLLKRFSADHFKARVFSVYYFLIFPWGNELREALPYYLEGKRAGLEHGDFEFTCYLVTQHALARLHTGTALPELRSEFVRNREDIHALGQERSILMQDILSQTVHELQNGPGSGGVLCGPHYVEADSLPRCLEPLDANLVFHNYLARIILAVFLGRRDEAVEAARVGRSHLDGAFGNYLGAVFGFYESMAYLMADPSTRGYPRLLRRVAANQRRLHRLAQRAPSNFLHLHHLVEAERCRVRGWRARAAELYERAIELAETNGISHIIALAQERAAIFYFARGMERLGRQYLRGAYHSYQRWGAPAIMQRLEAEHVRQFAFLSAGSRGGVSGALARLPETLDYRVLLKAFQAISEEILQPRLLERLLRTILEHAGAQRGVLVLERRGMLYVEAEADAEAKTVVFEAEPLEESTRVPQPIVLYAARTEKPVVLGDAAQEGLFVNDLYVRERRPLSVLCAPIQYQGRLLGLIYLENNRVSHLFTPAKLDILNLLASQAAISIANAQFHAVQMEAQQAKINPHFLFNALSSIADLTLVDGAKAEQAIIELARLYRYILTCSVDQLVTLDQELEVIQSYLALEQLRYGSKLEFSVETAGELTQVKLPGLLIQPLVENSIRHGIAPKLGPGKVSIQAAVKGAKCYITVQDDGDGVKHPGDGKSPTAGVGFGLKSVQERLTLAYGNDYSFAISQTQGYRVEIEIPI